MVRFEHVGLRYATPGGSGQPGLAPEVLRDLSFTLPQGSFHWLLGPSGAGKSSLLALMHLALRPSRGEIEVLGHSLSGVRRAALPALRRRIGVVYQDFRLLPHLNVFDNVALPMRVAGRAEAQLRADAAEMLRWAGLERKLSALPATLSGGEQQRVAIARAVVMRPALLVADEPTGNLDGPAGPPGAGPAAGDAPPGHHRGGRHPCRGAGRRTSRARRSGWPRAGWCGMAEARPARRSLPRLRRSRGRDPLGLRRALSDRLLPALVAAMALLAALALAGAHGATELTARWEGGAAAAMTVQLPANAGPARLERALAALVAMPEVAEARSMDQARMTALLRPWLGDQPALALPVVIELRLAGLPAAPEALARRIAAAVPGAAVEVAWRLGRPAGGPGAQPGGHRAGGAGAGRRHRRRGGRRRRPRRDRRPAGGDRHPARPRRDAIRISPGASPSAPPGWSRSVRPAAPCWRRRCWPASPTSPLRCSAPSRPSPCWTGPGPACRSARWRCCRCWPGRSAG